jgi:hypothetical protein
MKRTITSKIVLVIAFLAIFSASADAQLRFRPNNKLTIGPVEPFEYFCQTLFGNGMYFIGRTNSNLFFQIDITPANPRLAGTGNQVVFFNSRTSTFNDIQVRSVFNRSDARAKTNIRPLTRSSGLDIVSQLRPVKYHILDTEGDARSRANMEEIGLIAQEVEAILPNIVLTDDEGRKLINYIALIPVLIQAVQSLQDEIEALKGNQQIRQ